MLPALPGELWHIIAGHLVYIDAVDRRGPTELWQVYRPRSYEDDRKRWQAYQRRPYENDGKRTHPLKVFSQTCRLFSQIALPLLWADVYCFGSYNWDFYDMGHLIQLNIALDDPQVAKTVQKVKINARRDELYSERLAAARPAEMWEEMDISNVFPTIEEFLHVTAELGRKLARTNLREFVWRGMYRPPPSFYDGLSQCPRLTSFTLDLGRSCLPTANPGDYPAEDDALDRLTDLVTDAYLGFGAETGKTKMRTDFDAAPDGSYYDLRDTQNGRRGSAAGLERWLGGPNKLQSLFMAAPVLYHQSWLLPLWAKLIPQDIVHKEMNAGEPHVYTFGERMQDVDIPYERAAKAFRPLLLENRCTTPEEVLALIREKEELSIWQKWHFRLEGETKTIMERVIANLQA